MQNCLGIARKAVIVSGAAEGSTKLNAFDNALIKAGIHDYNLIKVSSILAKGTKIQKKFNGEIEKGSFVPCVLARAHGKNNETINAGIGVAFSKKGIGFVVEHTGQVKKTKLIQILKQKLTEMAKFRNTSISGKPIIKIVEYRTKNKSCAVAALIYLF